MGNHSDDDFFMGMILGTILGSGKSSGSGGGGGGGGCLTVFVVIATILFLGGLMGSCA